MVRGPDCTVPNQPIFFFHPTLTNNDSDEPTTMLPPQSPTCMPIRGTRFYQLTIIVLLIAFVYYIVLTLNLNRTTTNSDRDSELVIRYLPSHLFTALTPPQTTSPVNSTHAAVASGLKQDELKATVEDKAAGSNSFIQQYQTYINLPTILNETDYHQFVRAIYPPVGPEKGSIHDTRYLNTPIAYGSPLVPAKSNDGFPLGFVPRPACQKDSDLLQNYIYKNQHPEDCKTKKLLVRRFMRGYGLFAGITLSSSYLFLAAVLGRTLIDLSPNPYFTGNCDTNDIRCALLPVTNCTEADFKEADICYDKSCYETARVISIDREAITDVVPCPATEFPKERCNRYPNPHVSTSLNDLIPELGPHGEQFFQSEFFRYLTRPNQFFANYVAEQMKELKLTDQLIGVHIRHGDKEEGIQFPTRAYGVVVRRVIQITGIRTVFIGSDDKSVYEELPKWVDLPNVRYTWLNPDLNPIVFSAWQASLKGHNTIGLQLLTQALIDAQGQAFVGTRSSNLGQLVYSLQGNDCSRQKISFDMYGDLYYNMWYCRDDIEHVGREWMCALKPPPSGTMIHEWGGSKTQCYDGLAELQPGAKVTVNVASH